MKYVVFGAGGTGGCIGAYLAKAGFDVTLIARGSHLDEIRKNGITVLSERVGNFKVGVKACTAEEYCETPDVVFVCVKYYSLDDAAEFINRVANKNTLVVPILNVFGTGGVLQKKCPQATVCDGCIYIMGMVEKAGVILQSAPIFRMFLGFRDGQPHTLEKTAKQVVNDLNASRIDAFYSECILMQEIKKFSFVSPMGASCLYFNAVGADFHIDSEAKKMFFSLIDEIVILAKAMGITFDEDLIKVNEKIMSGLKDDSTTSMQRDVLCGRPSEIDGLVHRVVRLSKQYGVSLPNYKKISAWANEKGIK